LANVLANVVVSPHKIVQVASVIHLPDTLHKISQFRFREQRKDRVRVSPILSQDSSAIEVAGTLQDSIYRHELSTREEPRVLRKRRKNLRTWVPAC